MINHRTFASVSRFVFLVCAAFALVGCASSNLKPRAPVEERSASAGKASSSSGTTDASKPLPGAENAGKPGYYTVRPGDTLIRVGLESGQNWRDLQRWNNLENPDRIEIGQVLRVVAPGQDPTSTAAKPVSSARVDARALETRPLEPRVAAPATSGATVAASSTAAGSAAGAPASAIGSASTAVTAPTPAVIPARETAAARDSDEEPNWMWPASGGVTTAFDETRNKGVSIAGKAGDAVLAAADGRVVYAGSGLRGYGNLIIVKHNESYLSAYAHNQALLVREDQTVRRGQKIAEMGSSDADRVQLHFEIRRRGKPLDPVKLLPSR